MGKFDLYTGANIEIVPVVADPEVIKTLKMPASVEQVIRFTQNFSQQLPLIIRYGSWDYYVHQFLRSNNGNGFKLVNFGRDALATRLDAIRNLQGTSLARETIFGCNIRSEPALLPITECIATEHSIIFIANG